MATPRLVGMAAVALLERGVTEPMRHIAVIDIDSRGDLLRSGDVKARYTMTLLKPTPSSRSLHQCGERLAEGMHLGGEIVIQHGGLLGKVAATAWLSALPGSAAKDRRAMQGTTELLAVDSFGAQPAVPESASSCVPALAHAMRRA